MSLESMNIPPSHACAGFRQVLGIQGLCLFIRTFGDGFPSRKSAHFHNVITVRLFPTKEDLYSATRDLIPLDPKQPIRTCATDSIELPRVSIGTFVRWWVPPRGPTGLFVPRRPPRRCPPTSTAGGVVWGAVPGVRGRGRGVFFAVEKWRLLF